jgi:hypothetical protein
MRPAIKAILTEALYYDRPTAFEIDLARDIEYLYNHNPSRFVWALYDNGTQLLPAATDIPSPFVGSPPYPGLEFARAFHKTYGEFDGEHQTRYFVFEVPDGGGEGKLIQTSWDGAYEALRWWATTVEVEPKPYVYHYGGSKPYPND